MESGNSPNIAVVITARIASTRLASKVTRILGGRPMLGHVINRALDFPVIDSPERIVLAVPDSEENMVVAQIGTDYGVKVFRGDEDDVLGRIIGAANLVGAENIYRVTGDNPFIDPGVVRITWDGFNSGEWDYSVMEDTPLGTTAEIVTVDALKRAENIASETGLKKYREHPTLALYENSDRFRMNLIPSPEQWRGQEYRFTVDTEIDFNLVEKIMNDLGEDATLDEIMPYLEKHPDVAGMNSDVVQDGWTDLKKCKDLIEHA